ncbi:MAG: tRNA uridine-5-carboxymethylaminomethyl(34) synthesis enzyme MnmG [Methylotenera sp.]|nr:tRNA uridine-5-carboxymethylaminomethyl(34) synthesis enzyme MnmG [Oligoflexia bacterium]
MEFDVIVIGGGHAGTEAAHASAKMGCRTALVTLNPSRIGFMSCNPAMGGLAKGQLIREIDALGGIMGINTDKSAIQYRKLNSSKGPAVRSSRAQCDKALYAQRMQEFFLGLANLTIVPVEASEILLAEGKVRGIRTTDGSDIFAPNVIITSGTFLRAIMHTGFDQAPGGRAGDQSSTGLSASLEKLGFRLGRLKTGTPPRLHKDSIDYSKVEAQAGDVIPVPFSFYHRTQPFPLLPQVHCFITYTNELTHDIIEKNFDKSPMFTGIIQGIGPRYCPSIEDKVKRFRDRNRHQIFLEPEGLNTNEIYVNGISTSLPRDVQEAFVHSIVGLENAQFIRHGYAVEYDCVDARQLKATFESKDVPGLFFAGQVNGTSGYEEAGAQGLIAGINAAQKVLEKSPFVLSRLDGYIGVLADDLVLKGADEPYRMFTSRAEYRLLLREDNADLRLSEMGHELGLLGDEEYEIFCRRRDSISHWKDALSKNYFYPVTGVNDWLSARGLSPLKDRVSAEVLLRRPELTFDSLVELGLALGETVSADVREQVEIQVKYEGYIKRDLEVLEGVRKNEFLAIPLQLDFADVPGLSTEVRSRLARVRPETIGQATRLQGVTPAAVAAIMIFLKMKSSKATPVSDALHG